MLVTSVCKQQDFGCSWFKKWRSILSSSAHELDKESAQVWGQVWQGMHDEKTMHRKLWEWFAISEALEQRGLLQKGRKGIGFAVGKEPLASIYASRGCQVVASDYTETSASQSWSESSQLAQSLRDIHWPGFLDYDDFVKRVQYERIDMRDLAAIDAETYDFSWSSCSFEHLGSLENGIRFLLESTKLLVKGGVGVHTTEFNLTSNTHTLDGGGSVIYRKTDIEQIDRRLRDVGCVLEGLNLDPGFLEHDVAFDYPPYYSHGRQHIKLRIDKYVSTSILLVIRKWV